MTTKKSFKNIYKKIVKIIDLENLISKEKFLW